ncbi:MAG TPA: phenylalanine--tRNA ligase subunit alpha [Planctomycetes bacterium]|nr:phenylalanine--tRNA ligase subunit alpha [Planctomycetota bacterium]
MSSGTGAPELDRLEREALEEFSSAEDASRLEQIRLGFLGKKGTLTEVLRGLGKLPPEERAEVGSRANKVKVRLEEALEAARSRLGSESESRSSRDAFDVTLPGILPEQGSRHPIYQVAERMIHTFHNLGFQVADGPEVEDEWHNFIGLNIPPDHIARDPSQNFYLVDDLLLRSQTSTVQIRVMEQNSPPLRIIAPGKVYRPDTVDASHSFMFHQLEGLMVDEGVSFGELKTTLLLFFRQMFSREVEMRLRPSFFPFTEPSAEVDLSCPFCARKGCKVCSQSGWFEVGGCGMVDPNVFEAVGIDPEKYTGFAFGLGIDRLTMASHDIPDIRYLFENDVRFLEQFSY